MIWRTAAIGLAVLLALAAIPVVRHVRETPPPPPPAVRLALEPPAGAEFGSGSAGFDLALARSGREVIFAATTGGRSHLWRRRFDTLRAEPIANTPAATMPAYGPGESTVWYFANTRLYSMSLATGERREIMAAPTAAGIAVRSDGAILVATGGPIQRVTGVAASPVTTLRPGERSHAFPAWLETRDAFVYLVTLDDGRRVIRLHDGSDDVELTRGDSHALVAHGHLLFVRNGTLRAEPLDLDARRIGTPARTLAFDVGVSPQGLGAFAVGGHVLATGKPSQQQHVLRWFDDRGTPLAAISEPGDYWQVALSPGDRTVAVTVRDPLLRTLDVFTMPAAGGGMSRLTLALAADSDPAWAPDGKRIAFRSAQDGQPHIFARRLDATAGGDEAMWKSPLDEVPTGWSPQGLLFHARGASSGFDIWELPPTGAPPRAVVQSGFNEIDGRRSPDGRWLAYASDEGGQFDVYVGRGHNPAQRTRISMAGGTRPQWIAGGRALVFIRGSEILRADLVFEGALVRSATPMTLFSIAGMRDVAAGEHGSRLLVIAPKDGVQNRTIGVVVNWEPLLRSP